MKFYKHDTHLLERTKLLEGIICQTLTFTNARGVQWGTGDIANPYSALTNFSTTATNDPSNPEDNEFFKNFYETPVKKGAQIIVKSPQSIFDAYLEYRNLQDWILTSGTAKLTINGATMRLDSSESTTVTVDSSLSIKYELTYVYSYNPVGSNITISVDYIISAVESVLPLKPYSITDCICRVLELAKPLQHGEFPEFKLQGVEYSYEGMKLVRTIMPGSQAARYNKIQAPNFTMSQCTLREQLKIIGSKIHAEPRLGYKPTPTTVEENTIWFEEYGNNEQSSLSENGYIYRGLAQNINEYCTSVTTNISNLVNSLNYADGTVKDPNASCFTTLRTDVVNVMMSESDSYIKTKFPIYDVIKVEAILLYDGDNQVFDITPFVFEEHEYKAVLSSYEGSYPYSKAYAIYYTQGQEGIRGLFYEYAVSNGVAKYSIENILNSVRGTNLSLSLLWTRLAFRVTYIPVTNAMLSHGKQLMMSGNHEYSSIYAQSENLVESSYFGENLKGVALRLGNVECVKTYLLPSKSAIPKTGQRLGDFMISAVSCSYHHTYIKCTVALTQYFNRLSQYVGIDSHKRISEISEREAHERSVLLKEYIVIGDREESSINTFVKDIRPIVYGLVGTIYPGVINRNPIDTCVCGGTTPSYFQKINNLKWIDYYNAYALPVVSAALGNSMVFTWQYKDNYSAIEHLIRNNNSLGEFEALYAQDMPYSNYYGRFTWYDFALCNNFQLTENNLANNLKFADGANADVALYAFPDAVESPICTARRVPDNVEQGIYNPVLIRKDSRESLMFNYELEYITNRTDLIIGSNIAKKCPLIGENTNVHANYVNLYLFKGLKFNEYPTTILDLAGKYEGEPYQYKVSNLWVGGDTITIPYSYLKGSEFDSWCLAYDVYEGGQIKYADEDGNETTANEWKGGEILIACNNDREWYQNKTDDEQITISIVKSNIK